MGAQCGCSALAPPHTHTLLLAMCHLWASLRPASPWALALAGFTARRGGDAIARAESLGTPGRESGSALGFVAKEEGLKPPLPAGFSRLGRARAGQQGRRMDAGRSCLCPPRHTSKLLGANLMGARPGPEWAAEWVCQCGQPGGTSAPRTQTAALFTVKVTQCFQRCSCLSVWGKSKKTKCKSNKPFHGNVSWLPYLRPSGADGTRSY